MWQHVTLMGYKVVAKIYRDRSSMGIHAGRISKLDILKDGKIVAHYDRGWDFHDIPWMTIDKIVGALEHIF